MNLQDHSLLPGVTLHSSSLTPSTSIPTSTFQVIDPATSHPIAILPDSAAEHCRTAITNSLSANETLKSLTARARASLLLKWHELVLKSETDMATIITAENGKTTREARDEVKYAADFLFWFAGEAQRVYGSVSYPSLLLLLLLLLCNPIFYPQYKSQNNSPTHRPCLDHHTLDKGDEDGTTMGPLISARAAEKVASHVKDAVERGARVVVGGGVANELGGAFFEPTVLVDVSPDSICMEEETFGPLVPVVRLEREDEAVKMANRVAAGLAGYIFTESIARSERVSEALEVGMVGVNTGKISDPAVPFGGVKESGIGREGSCLGIHEYLEVKSLTINASP
ncbi:Aldehyde/histidinol dehydrogenase [Aspergillus spectabilis]